MAGEVTAYVSYHVSWLWHCTQRIYAENSENIDRNSTCTFLTTAQGKAGDLGNF